MVRKFSLLAVAACLCLGGIVQAAPLSANFGYTVDEEGGHALDADVSVSPTEHLTLSAGAGLSRGSDETSDLEGALLSAGLSVHGDRGGLSLDFNTFDDSSNYQSSTLAARGWLNAGDFQLALLARQRDIAVDVTLQLPLRTVRRELDFTGLGGGLELTYATDTFSAYLLGIEYDYDDDFDRFVDVINSPELAQRPRIEALVGSIITQTQGAIDRQLGAGIEFGGERNTWSLDFSYVHDPLLDTESTSVTVTWRHAQTAHVDWGLLAGLIDSQDFGNVSFVGAQIGLAN